MKPFEHYVFDNPIKLLIQLSNDMADLAICAFMSVDKLQVLQNVIPNVPSMGIKAAITFMAN